MALGPSLCPEQGGTCHSQDYLAKENKPDPVALSCPSLCVYVGVGGGLITELKTLQLAGNRKAQQPLV